MVNFSTPTRSSVGKRVKTGDGGSLSSEWRRRSAPSADLWSPSKSVPKQKKSTIARNIRVVARIRPMNYDETKNNSSNVVFPILATVASPLRTSASFTFNEKVSTPTQRLQHPFQNHLGPSASPATPASPSRRASSIPTPKAGSCHKTRHLDTSLSQNDNLVNSNAETTSTSIRIASSSNKTFDFDAVFGSNSSQTEVYERSVGDSVRRNIFRGFNTTVLTFGQTGSGKTYTMSGKNIQEETSSRTVSEIVSKMSKEYEIDEGRNIVLPEIEEEDGILVRAVNDLFKARSLQAGKIQIKLTYIEVYNDEIRDLLADPISNGHKADLGLRDYGEGGIAIKNLTKIQVTRPEHVRELIEVGSQRRASGVTSINDKSSRSHAICTLHVSISPFQKASTIAPSMNDNETTYAKLTLVDLAGSERIKTAKTEGLQQKESISINTDLHALGKVVLALAEKRNQESSRRQSKIHVPYRDSVLTRLLRDSLGGNCCTVMVACISPAIESVEESVYTLRYAQRTRSIKNSIIRNVSKKKKSNPNEVVQLKRENKKMRDLLCKALERIRNIETRDPFSASESTTNEENPQIRLLNALSIIGININERDLHNLSEIDLRNLILIQQTMKSNDSQDSRDKDDNMSQVSQVSYPSTLDESLTTFNTLGNDTFSGNFMNDGFEDEDFSLQEKVAGLTLEFNDSIDTDECKKMIGEAEFQSGTSNAGNHKELSDSKRILEQISVLETQKQTLHTSLTELTKEEKLISTQLSELKIECIDLNDEKNAQKDVLDSLRKSIQDLSDEEAKVKLRLKEYNDMTSIMNKLEEEKILREKYELQASQLKEELKQYEIEKETKRKESQDFLEEVDKVESKRTELKRQISALAKERNLLVEEVEGVQDIAAVNQELYEERAACEKAQKKSREFEVMIQKLREENLKIASEKTDLQMRVTKLEHIEIEDRNACDSRSVAPTVSSRTSGGSQYDNFSVGAMTIDSHSIRLHAEKVLNMAKKAIEKKEETETPSRAALPIPPRSINRIPKTPDRRDREIISIASAHIPKSMKKEKKVNFGSTPESKHRDCCSKTDCTCFSSSFSGNAHHIDFFLPLLGKACKCNKNIETNKINSDPTDLKNILRPWQVEFLSSVGITTARQLLNARRTESRNLAKALITWRKLKKMKPVKLKSCFVALHIWARTTKITLRTHKQVMRSKNNFATPLNIPPTNVLDIDFGRDDRSISTLGDETLGERMEI